MSGRTGLELLYLFSGLCLLFPQALQILASLLNTLLKILRIVAGAILIQQTIRLLNGVERLLLRGLLLLAVSSVFSITHVLRRLPQVVRGLLHLRIVLLGSLLFQLTRHLFKIATQLLDVALVGFGIRILLALLPLQLGLLAFGKLLELVRSFLFLRRLLLSFTTLNAFVLVLALIQLQFEQIGKIFSVLLTAATAASATTLPLLHLDFRIECCSFAKIVVGLTLERNRRRGIGLHHPERKRVLAAEDLGDGMRGDVAEGCAWVDHESGDLASDVATLLDRAIFWVATRISF